MYVHLTNSLWCVLGLCDAQSVTGIGILLSGYIVLDSGISAYHWQIMVYLAWLANLTHMSGLTLLRKYLRAHPNERNWRLLCMTILLALLLAAEIPTAFFNWISSEDPLSIYEEHLEVSAANATSYARCFFDMRVAWERFNAAPRCWIACSVDTERCQTKCVKHEFQSLGNTSAFQDMIVTILLLVFNFFTRVMKIMGRLSMWANYNLRLRLSRWWRKRTLLADSVFLRSPRDWTPRRILAWKCFLVKQRVALLLLSRLYADLYTSTLSEVSVHPSEAVVITVY